MQRSESGSVQALRDQFVTFISRLANQVEHLTIAARCRDASGVLVGQPFFQTPTLSFAALPYYGSTEDFYRRLPTILRHALPAIRREVEKADIVLLRLRHSLALPVSRAAQRVGRPLAIYWAGPPVSESTRRNYPGRTLHHRLARSVARFEEWTYRRLARKAVMHFFVDSTEFTRMGSPAPVSWVVPTLVNSGDVAATVSSRTGQDLRLIYAGRVFRHKGILDLIDAVANLRREGIPVSLDIAGQGPDEQVAATRVRDAGIADTVVFHGMLARDRLSEVLRSAHVFVLPSYAEGSPKSLWEAWAVGLAVVATNVGSISRFLVSGSNGWLIPPGDIGQLSTCLKRLALDEGQRRRLALAGLETARLHTWDAQIALIRAGLDAALTKVAVNGG